MDWGKLAKGGTHMKLLISLFLAVFLLFGVLLEGIPTALAKNSSQQGGTGTAAGANSQETLISVTGEVSTKIVNGDSYYVLLNNEGETLYYLEVGPPWFYRNNNNAHPLEGFINQEVNITGEVDQPRVALPENANPRAKANKANAKMAPTDAPTLDVYTIHDQTLRAPGRPPWAGGPKVVPGHPGRGNKGDR
jgi:hypothetical protein